MARRIGERVDPWLLAEQEKVLEGRIPLEDLPRLSSLLVEESGDAVVVLAFGKDDSGRSVVHSRIEADLKLECQRCLQSMNHVVNARSELALVRGPVEAEQLPEELDPLLVEENQVLQVLQLVEDELLLSIPISPRHPAGTCQEHAGSPAEELPDDKEAKNPFAVLAGLKTGSATDS